MKKFFKEFRAFAFKGNLFDMAVGIVIGAAFSAIVNSIVADLIMPLFGIIIGGIDFTALVVQVGDASITYGNLIQNIITFLIIAFTIFVIIKAASKFIKKEEAEEKKEEPKKSDEVVLLEKILAAIKGESEETEEEAEEAEKETEE